MLKNILIISAALGFSLINQIAVSQPSIVSTGWTISAPKGYQNAYLFVKVDNAYHAFPHYPGRELSLTANTQSNLKFQGVFLKMNDKILGTACENFTINTHQRLLVGGKITIGTDKKPNLKNINCILQNVN